MKLEKLRLVSFAKFQALLTCFVGILVGLLYSFGGLAIDFLVWIKLLSADEFGTAGLSYGTILAFGSLIGMPLVFALAGFILGLIEGILFNFYIERFKTIELDIWK